jgi:hypothetical protein
MYYLLGYHSTNEAQDGKYRKIAVRLNRKGMKVRARKGYYAPGGKRGEDAKAEDEKKDDPDRSAPLLQRAIDAPFELEGIPLRLATYTLEPADAYAANVLVATEVDIRQLAFERKKKRYTDRLSVVAVVLDMESGQRYSLNETVDLRLSEATHETYEHTWYPLHRSFELPTGEYQVRVVVLDANSRRLGSISHEFEVPELEGWRVSSPVLSDTLDPKGQKKGGLPRPLPLARRDFSAQGRLYCLFAVYGTEQVAAGFSLQTAGGREVFRGDPAPIRPDSKGQLVRLMGLPLEGLEAGEYSLVLEFQDQGTGTRYERREPFRIVGATPPAS